MATRKTYINSDEELVIKGALTIEGNVTQVETTQTVNRLQSDQFIINSDGDAVTSVLTLTGTGTFDNTNNLVLNKGDSLIKLSGSTVSKVRQLNDVNADKGINVTTTASTITTFTSYLF